MNTENTRTIDRVDGVSSMQPQTEAGLCAGATIVLLEEFVSVLG